MINADSQGKCGHAFKLTIKYLLADARGINLKHKYVVIPVTAGLK